MAINLKKISQTYGSKVYTEDGYLLGEVLDAVIEGNKVYGWKIKVLNPSLVGRGVKGLLVQHLLIRAMGQIWIVSRAVYSIKSHEEETNKREETSKENINIKVEKIE